MLTLLDDGFLTTISTKMGTITYSVFILDIRGFQNAFREELHNVTVFNIRSYMEFVFCTLIKCHCLEDCSRFNFYKYVALVNHQM